ncbi:MAG: ABC transporter permease [Armatimonadota bacterium]|nr:ABC transporter permease [Armatimonadota bacterium]MDR7448098.1 ABC transporter permease [Armatimonadota bacterium]MDR7459698.1 ABC transporter permease [Armatimonadota bacterium]MDR7478290.1 ABC transporter permease [Armatimonadota bacterium]MDR7487267.1 ABC transporter permease [Armatimonadota bacterium]
MQRYLMRRAVQTVVILFGLSLLLFTLLVFTPGDPVELLAASNPDIRPEDIAHLRRYYGLDDPLHIRYLKWLRTVLRGDLGYSRTYGQPVTAIMGERLKNTLMLLTAAFLIAFVVGVSVGIYSALHQYSPADYVVTVLSFVGLAMPVFWQGILFILLFAVWAPWAQLPGLAWLKLPAGGMMTPGVHGGVEGVLDRLRHLVLPTLVLATTGMASWARYTRSSVLEVIRQDYIRTARAKGNPERVVINRHALRNALIPIITLVALSLPGILDGAVITETVFSWPGTGLLLYQAVLGHDHYVAMAVLLFLALMTILSNLLADVAYALVDPRIRYD